MPSISIPPLVEKSTKQQTNTLYIPERIFNEINWKQFHTTIIREFAKSIVFSCHPQAPHIATLKRNREDFVCRGAHPRPRLCLYPRKVKGALKKSTGVSKLQSFSKPTGTKSNASIVYLEEQNKLTNISHYLYCFIPVCLYHMVFASKRLLPVLVILHQPEHGIHETRFPCAGTPDNPNPRAPDDGQIHTLQHMGEVLAVAHENVTNLQGQGEGGERKQRRLKRFCRGFHLCFHVLIRWGGIASMIY